MDFNITLSLIFAYLLYGYSALKYIFCECTCTLQYGSVLLKSSARSRPARVSVRVREPLWLLPRLRHRHEVTADAWEVPVNGR